MRDRTRVHMDAFDINPLRDYPSPVCAQGHFIKQNTTITEDFSKVTCKKCLKIIKGKHDQVVCPNPTMTEAYND
jgi:hypothetical protein